MNINVLPAMTLLIFFGTMTLESIAHDCFQDPMQDRYKNVKTISCKTCHPNNKDRSIHNEFGKLFVKELEGKELTKKFKEAEKKGDEAVAEVEKEMVKHFLEAIAVVEKKPMTFEELIKYGLLSGVRLEKPKKVDDK